MFYCHQNGSVSSLCLPLLPALQSKLKSLELRFLSELESNLTKLTSKHSIDGSLKGLVGKVLDSQSGGDPMLNLPVAVSEMRAWLASRASNLLVNKVRCFAS